MLLRLWRCGGFGRLACLALLLPCFYLFYIVSPATGRTGTIIRTSVRGHSNTSSLQHNATKSNKEEFLPSKYVDSSGHTSLIHPRGGPRRGRLGKSGKFRKDGKTAQSWPDYLHRKLSLLSHSRDTKPPDLNELDRLDPSRKVFSPETLAQIQAVKPMQVKHVWRNPEHYGFFEDSEFPKAFANLPNTMMMNPAMTKQYMEVMKTKKKKIEKPANSTEIQKTLGIVKSLIQKDKEIIEDTSMKKFNTPAGRSEPLKIMLVSTWRSGSTLLGMLIDSHPGVYHHYEPLNHFGIKQIRSAGDVQEALHVIQSLYSCKYKDLTQYLNYTRTYPDDMMGHNTRVWSSCKKGPNKNACFNATFLEQACAEFPIHTMKLVRLRLEDTESFLKDSSSDMKVIFLTRDPRGVMQSRYSSVKWCRSSPDCIQAKRLCADMEQDIQVSDNFAQKYPTKFAHVRYEHLAQDPYSVIPSLFKFLNLQYDDITMHFIKSHMFQNENSPWSTKRLAATRVNLWKQKLTENAIRKIQDACSAVIDRLGLEMMYNK